MKKTMIWLASVVLLNAGCAPMTPASSSASGSASIPAPPPAPEPALAAKISALPVVEMGTSSPPEGDFVLHIPANSSVPLMVTARGSLLKGDQSVTSSVTFARDIYIYKYWSSYDRKTWENSHKLLDVVFNGGMNASGLNVNVGLDMNH